MRALSHPGSILLVSTYELGHQPLGLASPLGFLARAGFAATARDLSVEPLDVEQIRAARLVGISVPMHTALRLGVRVAARIRAENPGCHVCFFGLYATLNAEHLLTAHGADSVIGGEHEGPLLALVQALDQQRSGEPIEGVIRRGQPPSPHLERLELALPDRTALPPLGRYAKLEHDGARVPVGRLEASRGCRHLCTHCPIPPVYGGRFFVVPRELVLADARRLVALGAAHLSFGDPDFLNGPGHSLRIVRELRAELPHLTYDFTAKIEHLLAHAEVFRELGGAGCLFVVSAVESFSDLVLAHLEKGHTRADVFRALAVLRDAGIALRPSFVPFTPWETLEGYLDLLDLVERHALIDHVDPVQYTIRLLVPPGSILLSRPAMQPFLGPLAPDAFTYRWSHPDPRMDALQRTVARLVEDAARRKEDPALTFTSVRAAALAACGTSRAPRGVALAAERRRPPRLTESWFC